MVVLKECMRFAHSEGHTEVCYSENGEYLVTSGSDGDVRIYHGHDDDDPVSIRIGRIVNSIDVTKDYFVAANDDNTVKLFVFPTGVDDGIVTRFSAQVAHVTFNASGDKIAAGAGDFDIKVTSVRNYSQHLLRGHEAPILSVAFDPKDVFLASSSCDGTVRIWDIKDQNCVQSLALLPKYNDVSAAKALCRLAWQPKNGDMLAIPVDKSIFLYKRSSWQQIESLEDDQNDVISIVSWFRNGKYLASASTDGTILIWNVLKKEIIEKVKHDKNLSISGLSWHPTANEIAYTDIEGQLGVCSNIIPTDKFNVLSTSAKKTLLSNGLSSVNANGVGDLADVGYNLEDDESINDDDIGIKHKRRKEMHFIVDSADEDISKASTTSGFDDLDGFIVDDSKIRINNEMKTAKMRSYRDIDALQVEFQPGSTPKHLKHRFMVWNSVGIIYYHDEDSMPFIDVEFHDPTVHHALHIANHVGYSMAALSLQVAVLASEGSDTEASTLKCLHFGTWDNSKEWSTSMPDKETIKAIAAGDTWVAAATDKLFIRIYSISGIQLGIISISGPILSMTGHRDILMIVYHAGAILAGNQQLGIKLIDAKMGRTIYRDMDTALPITAGSKLSWLGFSDEGLPVTYDTAGIVRTLQRSYGYSWIPILNTKQLTKNKSDTYWVVGLNGSARQLRCILCKASCYPSVVPRPVVTTLSIQIPMAEISTDKSSLEEKYIWNNCLKLVLNSEDDIVKDQNATIMKLFALACKSDRECRAAELCNLLPDEHTVNLAIKYAARNKRMILAQKLEDIRRQKTESVGERSEIEDEEYIPVVSHDRSLNDIDNNLIQRRANVLAPKMQDSTQLIEIDNNNRRKSLKSTIKGQYDQYQEENDIKMNSFAVNKGDSSSSISEGFNPFKVSESPSKRSRLRGTGYFDNLTSKDLTPGRRSSHSTDRKQELQKPKKTQRQAKLFNIPKAIIKDNEKKPKVSSFSLWFESIRPQLHKEDPSATQRDVVSVAAKKWREMPEDDKKIWLFKASQDADFEESQTSHVNSISMDENSQ